MIAISFNMSESPLIRREGPNGHRIPYFVQNSPFGNFSGPRGPYLLFLLVFAPVIRTIVDLESGTL